MATTKLPDSNLGKDSIRPAVTVLEARSGHKTEYESEGARKNIGR